MKAYKIYQLLGKKVVEVDAVYMSLKSFVDEAKKAYKKNCEIKIGKIVPIINITHSKGVDRFSFKKVELVGVKDEKN